MHTHRIFTSAKFFQPTAGEPIRSIITESQEAAVVAWYIKLGQKVSPHLHPSGQDTWTVLTGEGVYYLDSLGNTQRIIAGDVVIAPTGAIHGVTNSSNEPLVFISVVTPSAAGYQLVLLGD